MNLHPTPANPLSARELILTLIDSSREEVLQASYFIAAGELFSMDSSAIRVALARLVQNADLQTAKRGQYRRRNRGGEFHSMVRNWSEVEEGLQDWGGAWLGAAVSHLGRSNSTRVRSRERALRLLGFAPLSAGLWIRPANLRASMTAVRDRLLYLGLEPEALLATLDEIVPAESLQPQQLWPLAQLELRYGTNLKLLASSERSLQRLNEAERARETLLTGRSVTRDILLDPLLPAELIDTNLRGRMIAAMKQYDRLGKSLWRAFYQRHHKS